tara:strand:- start:269 stop:406 length:138 start_codon:yes stop_codon:yes gene_type:complete
MIKIFIGIVIGIFLVEFNVLPEILNFFVESGLNDKTIETLEGLNK